MLPLLFDLKYKKTRSPLAAQIVSDHQNNTYYTTHLRTSSHLSALRVDNESVNPVSVSEPTTVLTISKIE